MSKGDRAMRAKIRLLVFAVAAAGVAWFFLLGSRARSPRAARFVPEPAASQIDTAQRSPEQAAAAAPSPEWIPEPPRTAPVLDAVTVEKADVCAGEESLVTVNAHAVDGDDVHMRVFIDGQEGSRIPVRPLFAAGAARTVFARLVARDGSEVSAEVPLRAHDCKASAQASIAAHALANSWDDYELSAQVVGAFNHVSDDVRLIDPKDVVAYSWDFGDGETVESRAPVVAHSYERRAQVRPSSSFLLAVDVRLKDGQRVRGRSTLTLQNPAFQTLEERGVILLMSSLYPRFPVAAADGSVTQTVRLWHASSEAVAVRGLARWSSDRSGQRSDPETLDPRAVVGARSIPPGRAVEFTVTIPAGEEPFYSFDVIGSGKDDKVARGHFSIMRPPPVPTKENSTPIDDPQLVAQVRSAQRILGKPTVSDGDLAKLRAEGRI
jgi:hypothetical protein